MENLFKRAFYKMLDESEGLSELDKVIKYASNPLERKRAKHDKKLMELMKDRPIQILFLHEMKSIEVAKDLICLMSYEELKDNDSKENA